MIKWLSRIFFFVICSKNSKIQHVWSRFTHWISKIGKSTSRNHSIIFKQAPISEFLFLAAVLNIFEKDDSNQEIGFRIDYLENPAHQQVFKSIHKDFEWIQQNTYSLLAICNFLPQIFAPAQSPNTRATAQETRDAFIEVISKDEYKDLRDIMNEANPEDERESLDKFISLVHTISRSLFILIVKIHQAIVLNYHFGDFKQRSCFSTG